MQFFCRSIDDIENAIEDANEQTENMKQIQEVLATPFGASAEFDEVCWLSTLCISQQTFIALPHVTHTVSFQDA
jgi:hypothetical protein